MRWQRWVEDTGYGPYSDLSVAVDEIYALRLALADEAAILEQHLDYKTFPKSRRAVAERQIQRMRQAASGDYKGARREKADPRRVFQEIGVSDTLVNHEWAEQRGLVPYEETTAQNALDRIRALHDPETGECRECSGLGGCEIRPILDEAP